MQKTIEIKLDAKDIVLMKRRKVYNIERFIKINEKGDQVLLNFVVPAEHVRTKTLNLTLDVEDAPIIRNDSKTLMPIRA
jgi:hypothetical protein